MCIFKLCAAISQDCGLLEIGPLYYKHTQLNVCEKEELPCFLYLLQIFALGLLSANHNTELPGGARPNGYTVQ